MESEPAIAQSEDRFLSLLETQPLPLPELLILIHSASTSGSASKATEWCTLLIQQLSEASNFHGLYQVIKGCADLLAQSLSPAGIRDTLKRADKQRQMTAQLDTAAFGEVLLAESFRRLDLLLALIPGTFVIDPTWGFGIVKRTDGFYKRITIDFTGKPGHAMSFAAACDSLVLAPHDHLLTQRHNAPDRIARLATEDPGELVRQALKHFGDMTVAKLETVLTKQGFVAASDWKRFWDAARKALKNDSLVIVPSKRSDPLQLRLEAESYGTPWFEKLATMKDALKILAAIEELETTGKVAGIEDTQRGIIEERLGFAIKGAHSTDPALYARLSVTINRLGFLTPPVDQLRAHLWERHRFVEASEKLSVKDVAAMTTFLLAEGGHVNGRLLDALPQMPYNLLNELLTSLKTTPEAAEACRRLLSSPKAPPPLISWIFRFRKELDWELPPLGELLNHAIAIMEAKLSGEALRMQNNLKVLFEQAKWLESVFEELDEPQRQRFFERIQASPAWDPATHRSLLGRMLRLDPALSDRKRTIATQPQAELRLTSWRSLTERQLLYKKLIEVDLPKNSQDIAVARSYGDLRENFEYQAAKDYQRQLLQRQAEIQLELKQVKGTDFADVPCDKVTPGTTVVLRLTDGSQRTYTLLGEWDRDEELSIISSKTRMAISLEGKKVGENAMIPSPEGEESALIEAILPLNEALRNWIKSPPEEKA